MEKLTLEQEKYLCRVNKMNAYDIVDELNSLKIELSKAEMNKDIPHINFYLVEITIVETVLITRYIKN